MNIPNSTLPGRASPERRVAAYYFVQAMSVGAINAFAGIWLSHKGMTASEIGVIFAVPVGLIILINVWVGRIADRSSDWRDVIVIGAMASAVAPLGLLFADGFWGILFVWTLAVITQMVILPVTDAAAMRLSRRTGGDFGRLYAWKTVGYLLTVTLAGFLLVHFGTPAFLPLFVGLSIARGLASLVLPKFRADSTSNAKSTSRKFLVGTMRLGFVLPLIAWSMVHCTHFVLNGFLGLLWHQQGLSPGMIGILIGVSSLSETGMFLAFKKFLSRIPARKLILISCLFGVLRWTIFALTPSVEILFILQLLHAATYAMGFLACTNFIADIASEDVAAEAQSFFSILQSALAIVALIGFGWLTETWGERAFLASAIFAGIGALLVISASRFRMWSEIN